MWIALLWLAACVTISAADSRENALVLRLRQVISDTLSLGHSEVSGFANCHFAQTGVGGLFDRLAAHNRPFRSTAGMRVPEYALHCDPRVQTRGIQPRGLPQEGHEEHGDYDDLIPPTSVIILVTAVPCVAIVLIAGVVVVSFIMGDHPTLKRVFSKLKSSPAETPILPVMNVPPPPQPQPRRQPAPFVVTQPSPTSGYGDIPDDY
jgi:hypothetical protein